jgi:hypothetical protein
MPPLHDFRCPKGHITTELVGHGIRHVGCKICGFPELAEMVFLTPPMSFVQPDVSYTSPVDGRPITTYQQHLEDLARNDCVVYESGIKQDQERNARLREEALERSVDETVDREIALMPAVKREKLTAELEAGFVAVPERGAVPARPIVTLLEK